MGAPFAGEAPSLRQRLDDLLGEERVAAGALEDAAGQLAERVVRTEQVAEELATGAVAERSERELVVVRSTQPRRPVLRPKVRQQERPGAAHRCRDFRDQIVARA